MNEYIEVLLRSVITFIGLLGLALLMGRKQLSQITFFNYIVGITIGSIVAVIVVDRSINVIDGIIAIVAWSIMPIIVGCIAMKSVRFRAIVDGEPIIVIQNGVIINKNMLREKYNMGDLLMQLRDKDVFDISEVNYALLEPNGTLSDLKKQQNITVTLKDINIPTASSGLFIELIIDGQILEKHLNSLGKDRLWLQNELKSKSVTDINTVVFAGYHSNSGLYVSLRNDLKGTHLV
jgi:Predicted membrane protein